MATDHEHQQSPMTANRQSSDFSISAILSDFNRPTKLPVVENECNFPAENIDKSQQGLEWLHYTRYTPPKLPRLKHKESIRKRRLGRNPRVPFSNGQVALLETRFRLTQYVSGTDVMELALALGLTENRVKIWFQNRRARERREKTASFSTAVNVSLIPVTVSSVEATQYWQYIPQQPAKIVNLTPSPASAFNTVLPSTISSLSNAKRL